MFTVRFWIGRPKLDHSKINRYEAAWKAIRVALLTSKCRQLFEETHSIIEMIEMEFEIGAMEEIISAARESME